MDPNRIAAAPYETTSAARQRRQRLLMLTHYSVMANIGFRDINRVMSYITSLELFLGPLVPLFFLVWTSSGRWAEFGPTVFTGV